MKAATYMYIPFHKHIILCACAKPGYAPDIKVHLYMKACTHSHYVPHKRWCSLLGQVGKIRRHNLNPLSVLSTVQKDGQVHVHVYIFAILVKTAKLSTLSHCRHVGAMCILQFSMSMLPQRPRLACSGDVNPQLCYRLRQAPILAAKRCHHHK